jgi:hypothetical protein
MLVAPGRFLDFFGWRPIDPLMTRVLGAALLGFGWTSYRGWRAAGWDQVRFIVEAEAIFCTLAVLGLARHILVAAWPWYVWMIFILYAIFAVAWIYHLVKQRQA